MPESDFLRSPTTGRPLEFNVPAVQEGEIDPQALAQLFQGRKIAEAEKAMAAAIQFQGLRGYQNALQSGKPAAEALTRYGPMMFYTRPQAFGPAVRAITPPEITPYQQAVLDERKRVANRNVIRGVPGVGAVGINPDTMQSTVIERAQITPYQAGLTAELAKRRKLASDLGNVDSEIRKLRDRLNETRESNFDERGRISKRLRTLEQQRSAIFGADSPAIESPEPSATASVAPSVTVTPPVTEARSQFISTKSEYDKLPSGTEYIGKNGKRYRKP